MSVNGSNDRPVYFHIPDSNALSTYTNTLSQEERSFLSWKVYNLAEEAGVEMDASDPDWGANHLHDCPSRLAAALLEQRTLFIQGESGCSRRVADLLMKQCPLVDCPNPGRSTLNDLIQRAKNLHRMEQLQERLNRKYPTLNMGPDGNEGRSRAWKSQEVFFLTLPVFLSSKDQIRFEYFMSIGEEFMNGTYDAVTAAMILDRLLAREARHGAASDLQDHLSLLGLKAMAKEKILDATLTRAAESSYKDIFVIPSHEDKQAKFKPLNLRNTGKEVYAYSCDRALAIGMTAPTAELKIRFYKQLITIQELFKSSARLEGQKHSDEAETLRKHAFALFKADNFPQVVRESIFWQMFVLYGENGEKLLLNLEDFRTSDRDKVRAIENYISTDTFKEHLKLESQGSVQIWQKNCSGTVYECIATDPDGGRKLMDAPKVLVHFYAVQGIIKGSMDNHTSNTMVQLNEEGNAVLQFCDVDDETSMPGSHQFLNMRLWQLGLPQCNQPFDRAFLMLFSDQEILAKLKLLHLQSSSLLTPAEYGKQEERLAEMIRLFAGELGRREITLTPRELYFILFPGSREEFERVQKSFSETQAGNGNDFHSAIEMFEFHLNSLGKTQFANNPHYTKAGRHLSQDSAEERQMIDANLQVLQGIVFHRQPQEVQENNTPSVQIHVDEVLIGQQQVQTDVGNADAGVGSSTQDEEEGSGEVQQVQDSVPHIQIHIDGQEQMNQDPAGENVSSFQVEAQAGSSG